MTLKLTREMKKLIDSQIRAGKYDSPDEVILAALGTLTQKDSSRFAKGELDALLADGERSIRQQGTVDGEKSFATRHQRRQLRRKAS